MDGLVSLNRDVKNLMKPIHVENISDEHYVVVGLLPIFWQTRHGWYLAGDEVDYRLRQGIDVVFTLY